MLTDSLSLLFHSLTLPSLSPCSVLVECSFQSQGPFVSTPLTLRPASCWVPECMYNTACAFSICACKHWALRASVQVWNVLWCLRMPVCMCVSAYEFCVLLFSLFSCSCAPLNMSDVLERDITTGAEREASSLSSLSPQYITSYWHQSLFILPSPPHSLSMILSFIFRSLFPFLCFWISLFLSLYSSPLVAICCSHRLFQFGSARCFTSYNTSKVRVTVVQFKARPRANQSQQTGYTHGSACKSIHMFPSILSLSIHLTHV